MKQKTESVRRTLQGLTNEVFRRAGVNAPTDSSTKEVRKPSRKVGRKEKRLEKKKKRSHYFSGYTKPIVENEAKEETVQAPEVGVRKKKKRKKQKVDSFEQEEEDDPLAAELVYLENLLGDDKEKIGKELEQDGFDSELLSFLDGIVPQKEKKRGREETDDPLDHEVQYLEKKLNLTSGVMDDKFLKTMDSIGLDAEFLNFVDNVPKKRKTAEKTEKPAEELKGKYVPPHLRETEEEQSIETKLNSLFNKVSEGNLDIISHQIVQITEDLQRDRPEAYAVFAPLFVEAAVSNPHMNVLITACFAALTCTTAYTVHISFASAVVAELAARIRKYLETKEDIGVTKNVIIFLSLLFYFGLLPASVPFGLFKALFTDSPTEECIDLALTTLRYCGRTLRSQFPSDFKEVLLFLTAKTLKIKKEGRVKWLLMDLEELKNNKTVVSFTVMDRFDQTKSWLEGCSLMRGKKVKEMAFDLPFEFPEEPPKNWVQDPLNSGHIVKLATRGREISSPLWDEARSQGMNTDLRKAAYVALMGAEDDTHAIIRIDEVCKGPRQINDVCAVILHCALRGETNNPFFSLVMIGMCDKPGARGKKFAHEFKHALTNHLTQLHSCNKPSAQNLADIFAAGIASDAVNFPIGHLRFLKFDQVDASSPFSGVFGVFVQRMMERLFLLCEDLAARFSPLTKYEDVREGICVAIESLVAPRMNTIEDQEKLDTVRRALEGRG